MAVSGAGGWVPSAGYTVRNRQLSATGLTQNKPKEVVLDAITAARVLQFDPTVEVQIDMRRGQALADLRLRLRELGVID